MSHIPDNYDLWERHDAEQARKEAELPTCDDCGEPIYEGYYEIDGIKYCDECMSDKRKWVEI